jgi:precorrin-2/cobalt-factor-2 C20-methyltransferase
MQDRPSIPIGCLYGIGLGPGDPELVTVKASRLLAKLPHLFAPKADQVSLSIAKSIAAHHVGANVQFHETVYPMTRDPNVLRDSWRKAAAPVVAVLERGQDAGFITLGDPMLYSTFSYLMRAVRELLPNARVEIVPAVMSFAASAALTEFVLGEQKTQLTVAPAPDTEAGMSALIAQGGRLVMMKVGSRLPQLVDWLRASGHLAQTRLVVRAGLSGQRVITDLSRCDELDKVGYLSTLLVDLEPGEAL